MVTSASCLIHLKQQNGGGRWMAARLPAWPPLRGAVYNSRVWDSQKETPNRTSCGCKIPRCQELKIAATGSQQGWGGVGGWLGPCLQLRQQKEARGQLRFVALTSSLLLGAQLLILQSFSLLPWTDGMPLLGAGPSPRPLTWEPSLWPWSP